MGFQQEGDREQIVRQNALTIKQPLTEAPWERLFSISHAATQAALIKTWRYCQEAVAQKKAEANPLLQRGVAMVERLAAFISHQDALQAALLLPLVEAGMIDHATMASDFPPAINQLIQGVLQLSLIERPSSLQQPLTAAQWSKRRRMLLALIQDVRCVIIKLIERVVYLDAMKQQDLAWQQTVASGCQQLYAPLANCLGIAQLKWELDDLALRVLQPSAYRLLAAQLQERRCDREQAMAARVAELQGLLKQAGLTAQLSGRPKHLYSIWQKLQNKSKSFEQLFDVRALRIIVQEVAACYTVLSLLHAHYRSLATEFVDYIAHPKPNGYQSIHTVLLDARSEPMEIQIRTDAMHQAAELGVAAHWQYKAGAMAAMERRSQPRILWLRQLLAWQSALVTPSGIQPLLAEQWIYLLTPRGEVVELPMAATPLDFAYAIHTEVGHRCIGAKVNGRIVPLTYPLQMGEQVTILTQKAPHPRRDWLNPHYAFITTRRARVKIRAWLAQHDRLQPAQERRDPLKNSGLIRKSTLGLVSLQGTTPPGSLAVSSQASLSLPPGKVSVAGVDNLLVTFARCCHPRPTDRIRGFITRGRGVSIHRIGCHRLSDLQKRLPARLISVQWCPGVLHSNRT